MLRTGNTVSTESVTAPWSLGARSERTRRVRERRVTTRAGMQGRSNASVFTGRCTKRSEEEGNMADRQRSRRPVTLRKSLTFRVMRCRRVNSAAAATKASGA